MYTVKLSLYYTYMDTMYRSGGRGRGGEAGGGGDDVTAASNPGRGATGEGFLERYTSYERIDSSKFYITSFHWKL